MTAHFTVVVAALMTWLTLAAPAAQARGSARLATATLLDDVVTKDARGKAVKLRRGESVTRVQVDGNRVQVRTAAGKLVWLDGRKLKGSAEPPPTLPPPPPAPAAAPVEASVEEPPAESAPAPAVTPAQAQAPPARAEAAVETDAPSRHTAKLWAMRGGGLSLVALGLGMAALHVPLGVAGAALWVASANAITVNRSGVKLTDPVSLMLVGVLAQPVAVLAGLSVTVLAPLLAIGWAAGGTALGAALLLMQGLT